MSLATQALVVDPVPWIVIGALIMLVLCVGIGLLWAEVKKEKWIMIGRELEKENNNVKFKRTSGTRRVGKPRGKTSEQPPEDWECQLCGESFLNEPSLHAHMRNQHQVDTKSKQSRKRG